MSQTSKRAVGPGVALLMFAFVSATPVHAQQTAAFDLNSAGSGANLAGVYTSPYTGTINGGPTINVICDDFADNSYVPENWTAYVASLSNITSGTAPYTTDAKWQGSTYDPALTQAQAYEVAAILSIGILQSATGSTQQKDLSFALWGLFDPNGNGVSGDLGAFGQLSYYGDTTDEAAAVADLQKAIGDLTTGINGTSVSNYLSNYNVTIYSYDAAAGAPSCGGKPCPSAPPQEFITVSAPEASTSVLFAGDLLCLVGLMGFLRKRASQNR